MDDEMDGCECIFSPDMAVRRLLSLLRQSQTICTDTECFETGPSPSNQNESGDVSGDFMTMTVMTGLVMLLYLFVPRLGRNNRNALKNGPINNDRQGPNNGSPPPPPPPPPAIN